MKLQDLRITKKVPLKKNKKITGNYRRKYRAQFGRRPVLRAIEILKEKKKKYNCPSCSYQKKVSRISTGIYKCSKCFVQFASDSYTFLEK